MGRDYARERWGWGQDDGGRWSRADDYERAGRGAQRDYDRGDWSGPPRDYGRGPAMHGHRFERGGWGPDYDYDRRQWERDYDWDRTRWRGATREFDYNPGGWRGWERDYDYGRYGEPDDPTYWRYGPRAEPWRGHSADYQRFGGPGEGWSERGRDDRPSYAGRGPRGYQRSDQRVLEEVCDRLCDDPRVDASEIDVRVNGCEVTLSGTVESRYQKRLAEEVAESVWGVRDVHNQLRVVQPTSGSRLSGAAGATVQPDVAGEYPVGSAPPPTTGGMGGTTLRAQIREGLRVVGLDQNELGQVKEVRGGDFLLDRPMKRDVYVPFRAVRHVMGDHLVLNVPADQIDEQGWEQPDVVGQITAPIANAADTVSRHP